MPLTVAEYGVRDVFVPRPGCAFLDADIEGLELATLAQVEIWLNQDYRKAQQLNAGLDLHCVTGAVAVGKTYEEFRVAAKVVGSKREKNERNMAKVTNFGEPGGMAALTLISYARTSYGIRLGATDDNPKPTRLQQEAKAIELDAFWRRANPNDVDYLQRIKEFKGSDGSFSIIIGHPSIGNVIRRGGATYCAACNSPFQGLGALIAGEITWELQKACYFDTKSPLFGCRLVVHAYDEWLLEVPIPRLTEAGAELERIICKWAGPRKIPDVTLRAEAVAMNRWIKSAVRVESRTGELMIFGTPEADERLREIKKEKQAV